MDRDSDSRLPEHPAHDLWALPKIENVKIERSRYPTPRKHVVMGRVVEIKEGIEILVKTDGDIPVRALSPALRVGRTEVAENERVAVGQYRFFVLDEAELQDGAPISLTWVGFPAPRGRAKFRYRAPRAKVGR